MVGSNSCRIWRERALERVQQVTPSLARLRGAHPVTPSTAYKTSVITHQTQVLPWKLHAAKVWAMALSCQAATNTLACCHAALVGHKLIPTSHGGTLSAGHHSPCLCGSLDFITFPPKGTQGHPKPTIPSHSLSQSCAFLEPRVNTQLQVPPPLPCTYCLSPTLLPPHYLAPSSLSSSLPSSSSSLLALLALLAPFLLAHDRLPPRPAAAAADRQRRVRIPQHLPRLPRLPAHHTQPPKVRGPHRALL